MKKRTRTPSPQALTSNPTESEVRQQTPPRVAPRLKGKVKNVGIKPKRKSSKRA